MKDETWKVYELEAEIVRALGHPLRLAIADFLRHGEQCVCDIAEHLGAERSNVSRHLALMLRVGVLECRKDGLRMIYSLKTPCVLNFLACVSAVLREQLESNTTVLRNLQ